MKNKNILYVTFNSHIDLPWLWLLQESIEVWESTSASVLELMEKYPEFFFAQGSAQGYSWMEEKYPKTFTGITNRVKDGRWSIVGGMWVEPDCNMPDGESLVRQILYGKLYFKEKFGVNPGIAFIPDSFGYAKTLPQILAGSGFEWFITQKLRWNAVNKFPYDVFRWYGPDGSSVKTYMPYRYCEDLSDEGRLADEFNEYKYKTGFNEQLILVGIGDHGGGPNEPMLQKLLKLKVEGIDVIKNTRIEDFLSLFDDRKLPSYKDELYLETHQGSFTTNARTKRLNRMAETLLEETEKFATIAALEGIAKYEREQMADIWKKALLNQFHDTLSGTCIKSAHEETYKFYDDIIDTGNRILNDSISCIARTIDTSGEGIPIIVFNPLSFERSDIVELELELDSADYGLFDQSRKRMISHYENGKLLFVAEDVPSLGYRTYWIRKQPRLKNKIKATGTSLENDYYRVEISEKTGNIARLFNKKPGVEVLQKGAQGNILQLFEDKPSLWDAWNIGYNGQVDEVDNVEEIKLIENNPVCAILRVVKKFGNSRFIQDIVLYSNIQRIDVNNHIDWHEKHTLLKVAFPVNVKSEKATYDIPYGIIERTTNPANSIEEARFEVSGAKWADLSGESFGISILNDCKYGWDIKKNVMRLTLLRSPTYPDPKKAEIPIRSNDEADFTDRGEHVFTYSIYPHEKGWREGGTIKKANELNCKLIPVIESPHKGALPTEKSFVNIKQDNFLLTAVKPAEESEGFILRFYETFGKSAKAEVVLPEEPKRVYLTDLMENKLSEIKFNGNKVLVPTKPYEIKTVLVCF